MKRKIFSIVAIAAIAFVSCKKEDENSTELGEATINGNVWADMDLTADGAEGVNGMSVKVEVNTQNWDQQPVPGYNYDQKVYTTTTDANGDYTLTIPATDDGYTVTIEFEDLYTTRTTSNGPEDVLVTRADVNKFIYSGAMISTQDMATVDVTNNNEMSGGTATIKGRINMAYDVTTWQAPAIPVIDQVFNTASNNPEQDLLWLYSGGNGPGGIQDLTVYNTTFDYSTGDYSVQVACNSMTGAPLTIELGIADFEGQRIEDNDAVTADTTYMGVWTTVGPAFVTVNGGQIMPNENITLGFTPYQ